MYTRLTKNGSATFVPPEHVPHWEALGWTVHESHESHETPETPDLTEDPENPEAPSEPADTPKTTTRKG